jgi:hypothetical protein
MGLFTKLWQVFKKILGLLVPAWSSARTSGFWNFIRWLAHFLLVILFLAGLYWLNTALGMRNLLNLSPRVPDFVGDWFLPILGLLTYVLGWLGWLIWLHLTSEEIASQFADINRDWDEAMRALYKANMPPPDFPLFLVLGEPADAEAALFDGARLTIRVRRAPAREDASLHVYAFRTGDHDSIFVTCPGASLLSRQAAILAGRADSGIEPVRQLVPTGTITATNVFASFGAERATQEGITRIARILADARRQGRTEAQLTPEEQMEARAISREGQEPLTQNAALLEERTARLKHLCRLIVRERKPFCPLNGILVLLPLAATDSADDAVETSKVCQHDLTAIQEVTQLHCPCWALLCDLEKITGFNEFVERLPERVKQQRLGKGYPLWPDFRMSAQNPSRSDEYSPGRPPATRDEMITGTVRWVSRSLLPSWLYRRFAVESAENNNMAEIVQENIQLYHLMRSLHLREPRLSQLMARGMMLRNEEPVWLGGSYIAGTGPDAERGQAFVAGVFRKVIESNASVSWTEEALVKDARYKNWARRGYYLLALLVLAAMGLGFVALRKFWSADA